MRKSILFSVAIIFLLLSTSAFAKKEGAMVELQTSMGNIVIELFEKEAPVTAANFKRYVEEGFYDGTVFHRVIDNFMIQGGGFTTDFVQKQTHPPIKNEADNGLKNDRYTIAMARTNDPHSASCQFFINTKNNDFLNFSAPSGSGWGYAVFGRVVEGMDVVDAISKVATANYGPHQNVPVDTVIIKKAAMKAPAKKASEKKAPAGKASEKKTSEKKASTAKTVAKKAPAKKAAAKTTGATAAKKPAVKKTAAKPAAKKTTAAKTTAASKKKA